MNVKFQFKLNQFLAAVLFCLVFCSVMIKLESRTMITHNSFDAAMEYCKAKKPKHIKITEAYTMISSSGIPGQKNERIYSIKLIPLIAGISFDSLWIQDKVFRVKLVPSSGPISTKPMPYKIGELMVLHASELIDPLVTKKTEKIIPPVAFSGMAMFSYTLNSKTYYQNIKKVETRPNPNQKK